MRLEDYHLFNVYVPSIIEIVPLSFSVISGLEKETTLQSYSETTKVKTFKHIYRNSSDKVFVIYKRDFKKHSKWFYPIKENIKFYLQNVDSEISFNIVYDHRSNRGYIKDLKYDDNGMFFTIDFIFLNNIMKFKTVKVYYYTLDGAVFHNTCGPAIITENRGFLFFIHGSDITDEVIKWMKENNVMLNESLNFNENDKIVFKLKFNY